MGRDTDSTDLEGLRPPKKRVHLTRDVRQRLIESRLNILAKLYKHGYTYREMRDEVMRRLDLEHYSLCSVKQDVDRLLKEFREERHMDEEANIGDALARLNEMLREAWNSWEESKQNYNLTSTTQRGRPNGGQEGGQDAGGGIVTLAVEQRSREVHQQGDPRFLEIIYKLNCERNKILGVYAPEKQIITSSVTVKNHITPEEAKEIISKLEEDY